MDYSILVKNNKTLSPSTQIIINQNDTKADRLSFLIHKNYSDLDITEACVILKYITAGNIIGSQLLESDFVERPGGYYKFNYLITNDFSNVAGIVKIQLQIILADVIFTTEEYEVTVQKVDAAFSNTKLKNSYTSIMELEDYLYEVEYDTLNYDYAKQYCDSKFPPIGGCSCVRKGNFYGRNYDWYYDEMPEFIVHVSATEDRHASLAVCQGIGDLTNKYVKSGSYNNEYDVVPFVVLDGINDAGVVCNINVVPTGDWGFTTGTTPAIELREEIPAMMLNRYILDNFSSAQDAVAYINDYVSVRMMYNEATAIEAHFMVADAERTYVMEFLDNELNILNVTNDKPFMTNFYLTDSVYNPTTHLVDRTSITPHSQGVERYEIIARKYNTITSVAEMMDLMHEDLRFTKAYEFNTTNPFWYTEFTGEYEEYGDITVTSPNEDFIPIIDIAHEQYVHRSRRTKETWQTVHSSVYNIDKKKLYIIPQEIGREYVREL